MVSFGQLVIGPPGSGKTTYCEGMRQLLEGMGRECLVVNMDFANDWLTKIKYAQESNGAICEFAPPDVDVRQLTTVDEIMESKSLGPNGSLIYAYKLLAENVPWLKAKIDEAKKAKGISSAYILFDMPGQVELYTTDDALRRIMRALGERDYGVRCVAVHLVDATLCSRLEHYISALLLSLSAQMGLELPFLNVFTKIDLVQEKDLAAKKLGIDYLAKAEDLQYLLPIVHPSCRWKGAEPKANEMEAKYATFHERVLELVEDFSLVSFMPLNIQDKELALDVLSMADQANGFAMSAYVPPKHR